MQAHLFFDLNLAIFIDFFIELRIELSELFNEIINFINLINTDDIIQFENVLSFLNTNFVFEFRAIYIYIILRLWRLYKKY